MQTKLLLPRNNIQDEIYKTSKYINDLIKIDLDPTFICVLDGAMFFFTDLLKYLPPSIEIDTIKVSSYGNEFQSSNNVKLIKDITKDINNRQVFIVEDIIATGNTINFLINYLNEKYKPYEINIVTLLDVPCQRKININPSVSVFTIDKDVFVYGYGLDLKGKYRNLPDIYEIIR